MSNGSDTDELGVKLLSMDPPESSGASSTISWPRTPDCTTRQLVRSWPVLAGRETERGLDRELESPDPIASACMKMKVTDDKAEPKQGSSACQQSHPAIVEFKELLAKLRGRRSRTVVDLAESLEILWCKGNLEDLGNLDKMWPIVVANSQFDLGPFLVKQWL